eukprot:gnl/TRDRNA2_/TRDRNA2_198201_c0_seq1.p1 gnl/TRDRNA2_/TRDRNA2_198201_c0~~gnl/TRDRNA2_/TRDRNA2_198201_c0_seq1.p1  ORF type:complete len:196 (+),score=9.57 gnl/TRDRNA2_/TRDRNA2_198201_c0_seq1:72-659(+)
MTDHSLVLTDPSLQQAISGGTCGIGKVYGGTCCIGKARILSSLLIGLVFAVLMRSVPLIHSSGKQLLAVQEPVISTNWHWQRVQEAKNRQLPRLSKPSHFTKPEMLSHGPMMWRRSDSHRRVGLGARDSQKVVESAQTALEPIERNTPTGERRFNPDGQNNSLDATKPLLLWILSVWIPSVLNFVFGWYSGGTPF